MRYIVIILFGLTASVCFAAEIEFVSKNPAEAKTPAEIKPSEAARAPLVAGLVRIKDVADILGARDNQLMGLGLVGGLDNTGDQSGTLFMQIAANLAAKYGIIIPSAQLQPKNVAVVAVTAILPPFLKKGSKIDVQVSSLGDATSLSGGLLLQCPLQGGDRQVYAVAQGALSVGGFSPKGASAGAGDSVTKNHTLVGRIPNGALVEREVETTLIRENVVRIILRKGDFTTAERMATAINERWHSSSKALDPCTVEFVLPKLDPATNDTPMTVLAELESLRLVPDATACVVINERTGTIVAGQQVRLMPTVLAHGSLVIRIKKTPEISQPLPLSSGKTAVVTDVNVTVTEEVKKALLLEQGPTLADLATALNSLKVTPRDLIAIFQALKEAGALSAELKIL